MGVNPKWGLTAENLAKWQKLGIKFINVIPAVQLQNPQRQEIENVITVGDLGTDIRSWFGKTNESIVILRPDRFVAAIAIPQTLNSISNQLFAKLHVK